MLAPGKLALAVVTGGLALGAVLGAAANPEMKKPPEPPWQGAPRAPYAADVSYQRVEAGPEDLSPYRGHDSHAPAFAAGVIDDWEPAYPAWTYSDFGSDVGEEPPELPPDDLSVLPEGVPAGPSEPPPETPGSEVLAPEPQVAEGLAALY